MKYNEIKKEKEELENRLKQLDIELEKLKDVENENSLLKLESDVADYSGKNLHKELHKLNKEVFLIVLYL